jgi:uncharacterized protein (TIGR03083 family)
MLSPSFSALTAECARLSTAVATLTPDQWASPTRCEPWTAAELLAHITGTVSRLEWMLEAPPPSAAAVTAAGYYRPDARFASDAVADRIAEGVAAAKDGGPAVAAAFDTTWRAVADRCHGEDPERLVTTRYGDAMTLEDYLTTRVVEVAVHGIDLADAVNRARWTTPKSTRLIVDLLLDQPDALATLGWDPVAFIAKATGRDTMSETERARVASLGITWLTLA